MIDAIARQATPDWLSRAAIEGEKAEIHLAELLSDSLYYPACGFDGTPVKYLAGNIHSFVYVDYGIRLPEYLTEVYGEGRRQGFRGYRPVLGKEVNLHSLLDPCWQLDLIPGSQYELRILGTRLRSCTPFAHWSVWKRREEFPREHGPELFSLLFIAGEMSFVYQGLYCGNEIRPKVLSIIQPGCFGGEWERTSRNDSFFKSVVLSNPAGMPDYLLQGGIGTGFHEKPCWCEYQGEMLARLPQRDAGLWALNPAVARREAYPRIFLRKRLAWQPLNEVIGKVNTLEEKYGEPSGEQELPLLSPCEKVSAWI